MQANNDNNNNDPVNDSNHDPSNKNCLSKPPYDQLSQEEKRTIALSPPDVVERLALLVSNTVGECPDIRIDTLVEPCAGDGRLARAVNDALSRHLQSQSQMLMMFDTSPLNVEKLDIMDPDHCFVLNQRLNGRTSAVILNPPHNLDTKLRSICHTSLALNGARICGLVLPGQYLDARELDALLPRFWHVTAFERQQPNPCPDASELTIVLVVAVRKSYDRTPALRIGVDDPLPVRFSYVSQNEPYDQAFQCGPIGRVIVVKSANEPITEGIWYFVKYHQDGLAVKADDIPIICKLVACRTTHLSGREGHGTWFPTVGTPTKFHVPQNALTDWLNHVLEDDARFFEGQHRKSELALQFLLGEREVAVRAALNQGCAGRLIDTIIGYAPKEIREQAAARFDQILRSISVAQQAMSNSSGDNTSLEKEEEEDENGSSVVDNGDVEKPQLNVLEKKCSLLQATCKMRADQQNESSPNILDSAHVCLERTRSAMQQFTDALQRGGDGLDLEAHRDIVRASDSFQCALGSYGKRTDEFDFIARLHMGRSLFIMKEGHKLSWKQMVCNDANGKQLSQKTLERHSKVYELVKDYGRLRFSWPFNNLARDSKKKITDAIEKQKLDFGGPAPLETIQSPNGPLEVIPVWFINLLKGPVIEANDCIVDDCIVDDGVSHVRASDHRTNSECIESVDGVALSIHKAPMEQGPVAMETGSPIRSLEGQSFECAICTETRDRRDGVRLECGHECICILCAFQHVSRDSTCPFCRRDICYFERKDGERVTVDHKKRKVEYDEDEIRRLYGDDMEDEVGDYDEEEEEDEYDDDEEEDEYDDDEEEDEYDDDEENDELLSSHEEGNLFY